MKVRLEAAARPADALRKGGGTLGDEDVDAAAGRAAGDAHVSAELVEDGLVVLAGGAQLGHPLWPLCEEVGHLARRGVEVAHELRVGEHEAPTSRVHRTSGMRYRAVFSELRANTRRPRLQRNAAECCGVQRSAVEHSGIVYRVLIGIKRSVFRI